MRHNDIFQNPLNYIIIIVVKCLRTEEVNRVLSDPSGRVTPESTPASRSSQGLWNAYSSQAPSGLSYWSGTTLVTMKMLTFRSNSLKQRKSGLYLVFFLPCTFSLYSVSCTKSVSERTRNSWEGKVFASASSWTHIVAVASLLLHIRNSPLSCTGMTAKMMER